jgi:hypothetical protein
MTFYNEMAVIALDMITEFDRPVTIRATTVQTQSSFKGASGTMMHNQSHDVRSCGRIARIIDPAPLGAIKD